MYLGPSLIEHFLEGFRAQIAFLRAMEGWRGMVMGMVWDVVMGMVRDVVMGMVRDVAMGMVW